MRRTTRYWLCFLIGGMAFGLSLWAQEIEEESWDIQREPAAAGEATFTLQGSYAPRPLPKDQDMQAMEAKRFARVYPFEIRNGLDIYKNHGRRDPKWDQAVLEFLEFYAQNRATTSPLPMYKIFPPRTQPLVDAGCTDPFILFCHGWGLLYGPRHMEAGPFLERAVEGLQAG
ncbi:MAG: hypothetical protein V1918_06140, partial [Planctomycetota bacterium]